MQNTPLTLTKFAGEAELFYLDCSNVLDEADSITGLVAMSCLPNDLAGADVLAFGAPVVNSTGIDFPDGSSARAGVVIMVRISDGAPVSDDAERIYTVIATFGTSLGNTKIVRGRLMLLPLSY